MTAGITGHQDLGTSDAAKWSRKQLIRLIEQLAIKHGFTSLAIGADQLFAFCLVTRGLPFTAIIPCRDYEKTFKSVSALKTYTSLANRASQILQLPFTEPTEQSFLAAGQKIVQLADVLVALWDGRPAKGLGGTADIVAYATAAGKPVLHLNPVSREMHEIP